MKELCRYGTSTGENKKKKQTQEIREERDFVSNLTVAHERLGFSV